VAALIRGGKLCKNCSAKRCCDKDEPIEIECPHCDGTGCEECNEGFFETCGCPNEYVRELSPAIRMADLFAKGLPPIAGGTLDQSVSFLEFARLLEYEDRLVKADAEF
jgi:hypothetical protein